jgi:hypothetical protein
MIQETKNGNGSVTVMNFGGFIRDMPGRLSYVPAERVDFLMYSRNKPEIPEKQTGRFRKRMAKFVRKLRHAIEEFEERLES